MSLKQIEEMAKDMDEIVCHKSDRISKHHLNIAAYLCGKGWHRLVENNSDVVEVVRCKDCKRYEELCENATMGRCKPPHISGFIYTNDCDFCSYGERKGANEYEKI